METSDSFVEDLIGEGARFDSAWADFLFNTKKLTMLKSASKATLTQILHAGQRYNGFGWSTSTASRVVYELSSVGIVKPSFDVYRNIWLYCLTMMGELDVGALELSTEQAEAAFGIMSGLEQEDNNPEEENEEEEDNLQFPWDRAELELPREAAELWRRAETGCKKVEIAKLLEATPVYAGLPARAPENNLGWLGKSRGDKFLKQVQQSVLHLLRVGIGQLSQPKTEVALQAWQYTAQLYWKINAERRDQAVPGIHREPDGEVLFSREDVQQQRVDQGVQRLSVLKIKRVVSSFISPAGHSFRFCFRSRTVQRNQGPVQRQRQVQQMPWTAI